MSFKFIQKIGKKTEKGDCIISYPKKILCKYDDIYNKILVSNGRSLVINSKKIKNYLRYQLKDTPLNFILDKEFLLNKLDEVKIIQENDETFFFEITYNNNLLRPSYDHMKALDPQNKQSFEDWRDSYYKSAQENVPMRVLILKSTSGSVGYELQGIKETDFANKLYQGKLKLDEITLVGCRSNGKPYMKENGIMDTTKSDASIYEAINNVYDIEFLESNNDGCTKNRQLCTQNNILACPFRFKSDDGNTRMSDVMAKYWNMDDKQLKPFIDWPYLKNLPLPENLPSLSFILFMFLPFLNFPLG